MIKITYEKIIQIVEENKKRINERSMKLFEFYNKTELDYGLIITDIIQLGKNLLFKQGFRLLEIPLKDCEMNAFYYDGGKHCKYVIMNTNLSRVNNNFALAHEFYHVFFHKKIVEQEAERYIIQYDCDIEEASANAFAGYILMPEKQFKLMYSKFEECSNTLCANKTVYSTYGYKLDVMIIICTIVELMCYFKTTYMSALIRCCELDLIVMDNKELLNVLLDCNDEDRLQLLMNVYMLDTTLLKPTNKNDFELSKTVIDGTKRSYIEMGYSTEEEISFTLNQLNSYYEKIVNVGVK